jgi:lipopolysaccharide transport system ATP-binding protein
MSDIAISAEGIGKQYHLGPRERYRTLRESITDVFSAPLRMLGTRQPETDETFWALRDVSFQAKHGELIGVIGRNGAGKSTLLKVLSRITEPTEGQARIYGRLASLLEVGTGFHPELTGRENIFLNGAILGMKRAEIKRKFDEIVAFAEVDRFIDTPVKRYSSGMYVRLAFAVAAHLEPEILVVDEVLAVGDHQFQAKCLNKMNDVGKAGRTVFFVSHSMSAIQRLCSRVLVLSGGHIHMDTDVVTGIGEYLNAGVTDSFSEPASSSRPSFKEAAVEVLGSIVRVRVVFESPFPISPPVLGFVIYDPLGNPVTGSNSRGGRGGPEPPAMLAGKIEIMIPLANLRPNQYFVSLWLGDSYRDYCIHEKVLQFDVEPTINPDDLEPRVHGSLYLRPEWRFSRDEDARGSLISSSSGKLEQER